MIKPLSIVVIVGAIIVPQFPSFTFAQDKGTQIESRESRRAAVRANRRAARANRRAVTERPEISDEEARQLLKDFDKNRDGKLTADDKFPAPVVEQFDGWDKNDDGILDLMELKTAGIRPFSGKVLLELFDANSDGVLGGRELRGPLVANRKRLDSDGDGILTKQELDKLRGWFPVGAFASGGQRNDPSFSPVVATPRFSESDAPTVAIDEGHRNFHTMEGRFKPFADVLKADGCSVVAHQGAFTAEALRAVDILVIANALPAGTRGADSVSAFTEDEIEVLKSWVHNGGALMLLADHKPYGEAAAMLGKVFGVEMSGGFVAETAVRGGRIVFSHANGRLPEHAILRGLEKDKPVTSVMSFTGQALRLPDHFTPLLSFGEGTVRYPERGGRRGAKSQDVSKWNQGGVAKIGKGRVAIFGEAGMFSAQISGSQRKMGMSAQGAEQNQQFLLNVIRWLAASL